MCAELCQGVCVCVLSYIRACVLSYVTVCVCAELRQGQGAPNEVAAAASL